jgi:hypothetical protein
MKTSQLTWDWYIENERNKSSTYEEVVQSSSHTSQKRNEFKQRKSPGTGSIDIKQYE